MSSETSGAASAAALTDAGSAMSRGSNVSTGAVNVPLTDELTAAGHPGQIPDLAAVRTHFEATWVRWNLVRTAGSLAAFGCLMWALVLQGRGRA
jgi:uncharacterized membrane protein